MDIELELEREALGTLAGQVSSYKVPWILVILAILPYHVHSSSLDDRSV